MYGDADTKAALEAQVAANAEQIMRESAVVQEDARKLDAAAELDEALASFSARSRAIAEAHAALTLRHSALVEALGSDPGLMDNPLFAWVGTDRYRQLHRAFGAMTTERQALMDRRSMLARDLGEHVGIVIAVSKREVGRYQIVPQHYMRSQTAPDLTDVLARLGELTP